MILLILFFIVAALIFLVALTWGWEEFDGWWGIIPALLVGAFFSFIAWLVFWGIGAVVTVCSDTEWSPDARVVELRALNTDTAGSGSFFLGSGYLKEGPAYAYITRSEDGAFLLDSIYTDQALVYETTDGSDARLKTGNVQPKSRLWSLVSVDAKPEFYVPAGSVQEPSYNITTEKD